VTGAGEIVEWIENEDTALLAGVLSDPVLRLLSLGVLCRGPNRLPLVAIDEPELRLYPRLGHAAQD